MEIQNKFEVGDKVNIKVSDKIGIISSLAIGDRDAKKIQYWVDYSTNEGEIKGKWFDDFEITEKYLRR